MKAIQEKEFLERVRLLGHDESVIAQGGECCTYFTVPTLLDARRVLSMATSANRQARQKTFFNPAVAARRRLGQGTHDRCEAMVVADGTIDDADRVGLSRHLPLHVKAVSVRQKTIKAGEVWDVSVRGEVWGLDDMEELYVTVNVGTLIIEPEASLIVRGNVFTLLCQEIIYLGDPNPDSFQIGILPTPFSVDFGHGPLHGTHGVDGANGRDGTNGRRLEVENTLLGLRLREREDRQALNGNHGEDGNHGANGVRGRNGGMCKLAELALRRVDGPITVFAQAGVGGNGGNGGCGGNGGRGGRGTDGRKLWNGIVAGGDGGNGGNGGDGGKGGHGGNGGVASNIYINVPVVDEHKITRLALPSSGGNPGIGGTGGTGGDAGRPGNGPSPEFDGKSGTDGQHGVSRPSGRSGRSRPAPWIFLNEKIDEDQNVANSLERSAVSAI